MTETGMVRDSREALVPNPMDTDTSFYRFQNLDLDELSETDLADEYYALRPQLWGLPPNHWLRTRVAALESELQRRRRSELDPRYKTPPPITAPTSKPEVKGGAVL